MTRASYAVIARLPSHTEYWYAEIVPKAGTRFTHRGEEYDVLSCQDLGKSRFVVRLELATDGAPSRVEANGSQVVGIAPDHP